MGQESIKVLSQDNYYDSFKKQLVSEAGKEFLHNNFKLGAGANKDKVRHAQMFYDMLCTDNCEIIDWVWDKIEGKLENVDCTKVDTKDLNCLKDCCDSCSVDDLIEDCCNWEEIKW
jgi:hypothetical protein